MPEPVGEAPANSGGITGALTRQMGPLKAWQWGAVIGGGYLLYRVVSGKGLFSGGGGGTVAPDLTAGDTGMVPGSALPPATNPPDTHPTAGTGGQGQADQPSGVIPTPTSPTGIHSTGGYGTGTSTTSITSISPSVPKTVQPAAAIEHNYTQIAAQQQVIATAAHKAATVAVNTQPTANRVGITAAQYLQMPVQGPPAPGFTGGGRVGSAATAAQKAKTIAANTQPTATKAGVRRETIKIQQQKKATAAHRARTIAANQ